MIVEEPTTMTPLEPRETGVPATVTAAALGVMVVPPMLTLPLGSSVADVPPPAAAAATAGDGRVIVEEPTTSPPGPRDTGVPEIEIAAAFGTSVEPAITTPPLEGRMEAGWPAADTTCGAGAWAGVGFAGGV